MRVEPIIDIQSVELEHEDDDDDVDITKDKLNKFINGLNKMYSDVDKDFKENPNCFKIHK